MTIQKILYDLLKEQNYAVYTSVSDNMEIPYILIDNISFIDLPYSQEFNKYQEVIATITIYDNRFSNESGITAMKNVCNLLQDLSKKNDMISKVTIQKSTKNDKKSFIGIITVKFLYIFNAKTVSLSAANL